MPIDPAEIEIGIFAMCVKGSMHLHKTDPMPSTNYHPEIDWFFRWPMRFVLDESLRLELEHLKRVSRF